MDRECRISAGGIIIDSGRILLVTHGAALHGKDVLVAPGGGVEGDESISDAAVREVKEETGLTVTPRRILFIEDMISRRKRVLKTWFLCTLAGGKLVKTENASREGITEAGWYRREDLSDSLVRPSMLLEIDWSQFLTDGWETRYLLNRDEDAEF